MTFRTFVLSRRALQNPRGDFIRDALADDAFPEATSWFELARYLETQNACPEAIKAARGVWREWCRSIGAPQRDY